MIIDAIPGDKSISHRAIIIGSLTNGTTTFDGFLTSEDCLCTLEIFRQLGVEISMDSTTVTIHGKGVSGLKKPKNQLHVGNSGTGIRLISGVLSGLPFDTEITGDASIQQRPMDRIIEPLTQMGAHITGNHGLPPLKIQGQTKLKNGWVYHMPVASAQVKSCVLLSAITTGVGVSVHEPEPCRDHTERMLQLFGATLTTTNGVIELTGPSLRAPVERIQIPADISSALFFICLSLMTNQPTTFKNIGLNPSRVGCLTVLKMMGADINIVPQKNSYEPMGDIQVGATHTLKNIEIPLSLIPNVIDELPILAILATACEGTMIVRGAHELRIKESDRIDGICRLVNALGGNIKEYEDGFDIRGPITSPQNIHFDAHYDHRLAMSGLIAAKAFGITANIEGKDSISTSFPNFLALLDAA